AVTCGTHARSVLDSLARLRDILCKVRPSHREDAAVVPAVTGDLVPPRGDLAQQGTMPPRHPSQRKEGRAGFQLVEQVEDFADVAIDPVGEAVPVAALDDILEGADLEPVLDVDRQSVDDWAARMPFGERNRIHRAVLP